MGWGMLPLNSKDPAGVLVQRVKQSTTFTNKIIRLETSLNEQVYQLFDLIPEEIKIIEESTKYQYGEV